MAVELNGINVIAESERKGVPSSLFWPWASANIAVLGISYGSWIFGFGISFLQASIAGVIGIVFSFFLVGLASLSGKRASAPTMIISRAAFGVRGNALPTLISYLLLVGWETILTATATLATATVLGRLGWLSGNPAKIVGFVVVVAVTVVVGIYGFELIMRVQTILTLVLTVLTIGYIALTWHKVHFDVLTALPGGSTQAVIGATVFAMTGFGLGWVNSGADYSRYLPRSSSSGAVVGWTTAGASIPSLVLLGYGLLLAGSDADLSTAISSDPIGALTTVLPVWYLILFAVTAVFGLVGGTILDIYSSGLALMTLGLRVARPYAVAIDGVLMTLGTIYIVWISHDFQSAFSGFLITLGVPIAGWAGVFLADQALRRRDLAEAELTDPQGRYGAISWPGVITLVLATGVGWGLVTNTYAKWLAWQGYLLAPVGLGGKDGAWAYANLGVLFALVIGFVGYFISARSRVSRQDVG